MSCYFGIFFSFILSFACAFAQETPLAVEEATATATTVATALATPIASAEPTVAVVAFQNIEVELNFLAEEKSPTQLMLVEKKRDMIIALKNTWGKWLIEKFPGQFSSPALPKKLRVELDVQISGNSPMEQMEASGFYSLEDAAGEGQLARGEMKQNALRISQNPTQSIESQVATSIYNLGIKTFRKWEDITLAISENHELMIVGDIGPGIINALSSQLISKLGDKVKVRPTQWGSDKVHIIIEGANYELLLSELKALNQVILSGKYRPVFIQERPQLKIKIVRQ